MHSSSHRQVRRLRIALVLGAGGHPGYPFQLAVLGAVERRLGIDLASSELVVGTSVGAMTGMLLRAGFSVTDLLDIAHGREPRAHAAHLLHDVLDLPAEMSWVSGDPTKESELGKVRLAHAAAAILVGARSTVPQQADARTILTAFTLRSFLTRADEAQRRNRPLYVVAEILDSENVEHARTAGADEVIETTRLGFSLVAHAIAIPGTGSIVSRVATAGAHSIWVGRIGKAGGETWPTNFGDLRRRLKEERDILLLGVRRGDPATGAGGEDRINPPDDTEVGPDTALVYLADHPRLPAA